jgi:hypothetical protein
VFYGRKEVGMKSGQVGCLRLKSLCIGRGVGVVDRLYWNIVGLNQSKIHNLGIGKEDSASHA